MERSPQPFAQALLALLACSGSASAQYVYKCSQGNQVSYQSQPCSGEAARVWHAPPQPIDPAIAAHNARIQEQMDRRSRAAATATPGRSSRPVAAAIGIARDQPACDRARAERDAAFARLGTRRTFEQSRHWDNRVFAACR